ncbi:MAG: efflux RND transporter periplasmic adaptor subunit [Acidobacteria bacterium]|nr:efflux RND transporter periplasmic adaptor subunit [Acidobacteriota bacterium]
MTRGGRKKILGGIVLALLLGCGGSPESPESSPPEAPATGEVTLSQEVIVAAGIRSVLVSKEVFHPHVVASGVIRPDSQRSVIIRSRIAGRVVRVAVDVGGKVGSGQLLATLEGPEVTAALARYRTAIAREAAARRAAERGAQLLQIGALSLAEVEARNSDAEVASAEAAAARQELSRLGLDPGGDPPDASHASEFRVSSPLSGIVLERHVSPGLLVEREAPLFSVADLSRVWAVADVYEKDLGQIQAEGEVEVRSDAFPDQVFLGRIAMVEPTLDEAARTAHMRVVLENPEGKLRPGLFVTVAVPLRGASEVEATAIPAGALQKISGLTAVFVELGGGRYELRPVEIGRDAHGFVEVRHGLVEGEKVVSEGAFVLKSELLKGTIEGED